MFGEPAAAVVRFVGGMRWRQEQRGACLRDALRDLLASDRRVQSVEEHHAIAYNRWRTGNF